MTRFECEAHGPCQTSCCWTCSASGEMTSRVRVDMSQPLFVPALPSAERIAQIRTEYARVRDMAETYGCQLDARFVRDLLAVIDARSVGRREGLRTLLADADLSDDAAFAYVVLRVGEAFGFAELGNAISVSRPTISRWMTRVTSPHFAVRESVRTFAFRMLDATLPVF